MKISWRRFQQAYPIAAEWPWASIAWPPSHWGRRNSLTPWLSPSTTPDVGTVVIVDRVTRPGGIRGWTPTGRISWRPASYPPLAVRTWPTYITASADPRWGRGYSAGTVGAVMPT